MQKLINVQDFKDGMEVAVTIKNKFGQILIKEGSKLEERHRTVLLTWGIQNFYISENEEKIESCYNETAINNAKEIIKTRLSWDYRNYSEEELYNLALEELLKKL